MMEAPKPDFKVVSGLRLANEDDRLGDSLHLRAMTSKYCAAKCNHLAVADNAARSDSDRAGCPIQIETRTPLYRSRDMTERADVCGHATRFKSIDYDAYRDRNRAHCSRIFTGKERLPR